MLGLLFPTQLFAQFGINLDPGGALVARGYATVLIAYGLLLYSMRNSTDMTILRPFVYSMIVFNLLEFVIQSTAGIQGITSEMIWGTVITHGCVFLLSVFAVIKLRTKNSYN